MDWRKFFTLATRHLELNPCLSPGPWSWCAWTTFESLNEDLVYWTRPMILENELGEIGADDGGTWGQPFLYSSFAHFIIPKKFRWEKYTSLGYEYGSHPQDIDGLSVVLKDNDIEHHISKYALEVKLF